ncbi:2-hydroxyacid dehydrogenase [Pseudomonas typographi]|uniref:2-hydroxyacid dehydrogenase n=1 Tax=Pseudomonas typographi TaxID=2715964 RepID=A0ABR7Z9C8_9PSED|nr:2-hydroxyacid dehydrogenase [Pseudomonas typographi]MBD1554868.1 2-hydroxyacid dehydrogenase [Pseudomonas typographi]MBD1589909.1 2-hydroxyacid dehydrogenase [Pseudomonas typographi]MBD1601914.1 2-hydroxyacid dehydrogenase [Pseudomonas typographi]
MTQAIPVLIMGALHPALQENVESHFAATRYYELPDKAAWLADHAASIRGVVTSGVYGATAELIGQLPNLEGIFSFGVGYDAIDIGAAKDRGIVVTNTPGVLDECVADIALALMLNVMRRLPEAERFLRAGKWEAAKFPMATKVGGKKLGIVGLGNIGEQIAKRAAAFDMQVFYHNRREKPGVPYTYYADLDAMIQACDVLVLAVPGGAGTEHLIDARRLALLGEKGYLINIARGSVVDETALIRALQAGTIAGAGLDVFEHEPKVPQALIDLDKVVLLPHLASGTFETRRAMADLVYRNLAGYFFENKQLATQVV